VPRPVDKDVCLQVSKFFTGTLRKKPVRFETG
jgi:hypothetical protein